MKVQAHDRERGITRDHDDCRHVATRAGLTPESQFIGDIGGDDFLEIVEAAAADDLAELLDELSGAKRRAKQRKRERRHEGLQLLAN